MWSPLLGGQGPQGASQGQFSHQGLGIWAQGDGELVSEEGAALSPPILTASRLAQRGEHYFGVCF